MLSIYIYISEKEKKTNICMVLFGLICCLLRNNMIYAVLISSIIYSLLYRKIYCCFIYIVICFFIVNNVIYPFVGVKEGDAKEKLCVPIQQMHMFIIMNIRA